MSSLRSNNDIQLPSYGPSKLFPSFGDERFHSLLRRPGLYRLQLEGANNENSNSHSSTIVISEKDKSLIPYQHLHEQKPEMYYLHSRNNKVCEYDRKLLYINDSYQQQKINNSN